MAKNKALLVEDSAVQAMALKRILENMNYEVELAANGIEALEKLRKVPANLIVSDTLMPKMDGFQLCRECKSDDKLRNIPFILTSASYTGKKSEEFALKLGADRFILKSIDPGQFHIITEELIQEYKEKPSGELKKPAMVEASFIREHEEHLMIKLEEQMLALREAQSLGRIGSWEYDIASKVIIWSEQVYKLYGRDPSQGPPTAEEEASYYSPEQTKELRDHAAKAIETGQEFVYDLEAKLPGGKTAYFYATMRPIKDSRNRVVKLVGTVQDITDRKKMEEEIKVSELKFRNIFDMANDGILIADIETKTFLDGNKSICRMLGYSIDEIKKMGVMDIHPKEDIPYIIDQFEKQSRGEITVSENLPVKLKDGSVRYMDVNANAVKIGGKTHTMGLFRDVTERRKLEEEREKLIYNLGKRVKEQKCIVEISKLAADPGLSTNELLGQAVNILPHGWQYPEITCVRIIQNGNELKTKNWRETEWKLSADIHMDGTITGKITVGYLEEKAPADEGPFLKEERTLINMIAEYLGHVIQHRQTEANIRKRMEELEVYYKSAMDREDKIIELKKEIEELKKTKDRRP